MAEARDRSGGNRREKRKAGAVVVKATGRTRTVDMRITNALLYQLSYGGSIRNWILPKRAPPGNGFRDSGVAGVGVGRHSNFSIIAFCSSRSHS